MVRIFSIIFQYIFCANNFAMCKLSCLSVIPVNRGLGVVGRIGQLNKKD